MILDDNICCMCFVHGLVCKKHVSQQGKRNNLLEGRPSYDNVSMELLDGKGARVCCKLRSVEEPAPKSVGSNYDDVSD